MPLLPTVRRFLGFALLLGAGPAFAPGRATEPPPIRLAFYTYGWFYDGGVGIDRDVVDELVRRGAFRFETQVLARARIWADLASGDLDMTVSGIQTPDRDRFAWFVPYLTMKNHAILRTRWKAQVKDATSFLARPDLQMGAVSSFRHGERQDQWLNLLRQQGRVQESATAEAIFRKLKEGRVDAMFSQPPVYRKYIRDLGLEGIVTVQDWTPGEAGVPHCLVLSRKRFTEADVARFQAIIRQMRSDGTLRRIFLRYLPKGEADQLLRF